MTTSLFFFEKSGKRARLTGVPFSSSGGQIKALDTATRALCGDSAIATRIESIPDFGELKKLKQLFDTFKTKQVLFDLLQKSMFTDGVNIFIGEESGYRMLRECSVISAPYEIDNQKVGVLGVIGPTRMNYDEVISVVDVTARLLGSALSANQQH